MARLMVTGSTVSVQVSLCNKPHQQPLSCPQLVRLLYTGGRKRRRSGFDVVGGKQHSTRTAGSKTIKEKNHCKER
eukprot:scaffold323223_cov14-Tisochrysis_lutea.AAC.1